jgi:LPS-assembly protein
LTGFIILQVLGLKPRLRLIPLLLCCVAGVSSADSLLEMFPGLMRDAGVPPSDDACPPEAKPVTRNAIGGSSFGGSPDAVLENVPVNCGIKVAAADGKEAGVATVPAHVPGGRWQILASSAQFSVTPPPEPQPESAETDPQSASTGSTSISALRVHGTQAVDMVAEGEVELQRDTLTLTADRLIYHETIDEVEAVGDVRLRYGLTGEMSGPSAKVVIGTRTGEFQSPVYSFSRTRPPLEEGGAPREVSGGGHADLLQLEGENQYRAKSATWSMCPAPHPDWYIKAGDLELDYDREIGTVRDGTVVFKDVPLVWLPWAEFPLVGQRHTGILPPTVAHSNTTGFDITIPYYWNIAPNYDFTLTPRYMTKRGMQVGAEVRYLGSGYNGEVRGEYLHDRITGEARSLGSLQHQQWLTPTLYGSLDLNAVSDDEYFEDLSTRVSMSSKVNLLREARLMYTGGSWWNASALAQSYQTLSPKGDDPITAPYRRLPQLTLNASRPGEFSGLFNGFSGLDFAWQSEFVRFVHPDDDRVDATRLTAYPQVSMPLQWSGFYFTPKVGLHYTRYDIDRDEAKTGMREKIERSVPIYSIDSGLTLERETQLFGHKYNQTLEPRLFYLKTAYRRQNDIPLFDTSRFDFGFAQIFSENIYTGGDRIADANQITAAVTSRLIDPATGVERLRVLFGQRHYFQDQGVTLNYLGDQDPLETPRTSRRTDILAGIGGQVGKNASIESLWQYNPRDNQTERYTATLRYNPGHTRALNLSYRFVRDILRDVDVSGQWPLWGQWYGVGRLTHSLRDHRLTEAIGGLEYNGGCWVLRLGMHRYAVREDKVTNSSFIQLELNDFTSIGTRNPVNLIKRSVPGYGRINAPGADRAFGD